jgi:hypothetical protein
MKRGVVFVVVMGIAAALGSAGLLAWSLTPRGRIEPVDVDFEHLDAALPAIRIRGTAHYRGVIHQTVPAGVFSEPQRYYVYALFPAFDTESREVQLLVRSQEPPSARVDYEFLEVEGWLDKPRPVTIPFQTEEMLGKAGYFFGEEVLVLEAWAQRTVDPADMADDGG